MIKEGNAMGFIRARGEEQKKIRIQQIVDAAASLYAEVGYDFGLSNISRDYFEDAHTGSLFATIGVNF